jgi:hypothetical protein
MLNDRMNASTPFGPSEVQCEIEGRPHQGYAENANQSRSAGKTGGRQSEAIALLTKQIRSRRVEPLCENLARCS